jgi:hypothetical protein
MYRDQRELILTGCVCWAENLIPSFVEQWFLRPSSHSYSSVPEAFSASSSRLYRRQLRLTLACIGCLRIVLENPISDGFICNQDSESRIIHRFILTLSGFGDHVVTLVSDSAPASFCSLRNINNTTPVSFLDKHRVLESQVTRYRPADSPAYLSVPFLDAHTSRCLSVVLSSPSLVVSESSTK